MQYDIFNLSFERWDIFLLSLLPALVNIGIFCYTFFFMRQNSTNNAFYVFVLLLGFAQFSDCLMRMSLSRETAFIWHQVSSSNWMFVLPFGLIFTLRYSGWYKKIAGPLLKVFLFLPAILCEFMIIGHLNKYEFVLSESWNWVANPEPTTATLIIILWTILQAFVMLALLWLAYFSNKKDVKERKQKLILALGFTVPFVAGILAEFLFPLVFEIDGIPLGTPSITAFSFAAIVALKEYRLFDYSPKHQWENIINNMNEGVLIVDNKERIMYANKKICQLLGYEFEELKGKVAREVIVEDEEHLKKIEQAIQERGDKKSGQYEIEVKTKSGDKIWALVSGSPYLDSKGKVIGSIGIHADINQLKKANDRIAESKFQLERAQAIAHIGSWEFNFATNEAVWSDEACKIYGFEPDNTGKNFDFWFSFIHPDDLGFVNKILSDSHSSFNDASFDHRIICKNGIVKHIHSASHFLFDNNGSPKGLLGICHDITEQKKAEIKLKTAIQELETFIYRASHDLKSPLASIIGLVNVSQMEIKDETSLLYLNLIREMAQKLDGTLTELEKSMRIKNAYSFEDPIDFQNLINECICNFKHIKEYERFNVFSEISLSDTFVSNKFILESIFQNLIGNSIKYRNRNCVESYLNIKISESNNQVRISFEDNGIGIGEKYLGRIFDMYYRANEFSKGSGMGLYLVKKGVEKLNGEITVSSKLGEGTTFTLLLNQIKMNKGFCYNKDVYLN